MCVFFHNDVSLRVKDIPTCVAPTPSLRRCRGRAETRAERERRRKEKREKRKKKREKIRNVKRMNIIKN